MGVVADTVDPSAAAPINIGLVNATSITLGKPNIPVNIQGVQSLPLSTVQVPGVGAVSPQESVVAASATPLNPLVSVHVITGNTGISTFTGGYEGMIATCIFTGTPTITVASNLTSANQIHLNSYATGTAPANFTCATTAGISCVKCFLFTSQLPGMTSGTGQWFEIT